MKNNPHKSVSLFASVVLGGFLFLGTTGCEDSASKKYADKIEQQRAEQARQAEELKQLKAQIADIKKDVSGLTGKTMVTEKKFDQLEEKVEKISKAGGTIKLEGEDFDKAQAIDVGSSPVKGSKNAAVTIVKFSDFQCSFCAKFYPVVDEVLKAYPNKVNFVVKNFPLSFHPLARPAAKLALAANEQGKYFEMVELLLANKAEVSEQKIKDYAKKLRLNSKRLIKDYKEKDAQWEKQITEDIQLGKQLDVRGTPTFFINGRKTQARDFAAFKAEIDRIPQ